MRFVVCRTFLQLVADDEYLDPPCSRAHSAPAALHHADPQRPVRTDAASKPRRKKTATAAATADAEDSDDVFEEYRAIVAREAALLPPEPVEQPAEASTRPRRRRRSRGDVSLGATARGGASVDELQIRIRPHFQGANDPRPVNAIFLMREGYGEIGFDHDPSFSTTTLRAYLLGINNKEWDDGYVVAYEGRSIQIGSTLCEQSIAPGAHLRLVRPAELDPCAQS